MRRSISLKAFIGEKGVIPDICGFIEEENGNKAFVSYSYAEIQPRDSYEMCCEKLVPFEPKDETLIYNKIGKINYTFSCLSFAETLIDFRRKASKIEQIYSFVTKFRLKQGAPAMEI